MVTRLLKQTSFATFLFLAAVLVFSRLLLPRFETHDVLSILSWDVFGYYLYLPAYFLHHDIALADFTWVQHILDTYHPTNSFYQAYMGPEGEFVMKYPMGMAILYLPFFFIGWLFASMLGYPVDGFSVPFQVSVAFGMILYAIAGLRFLRKVLLRFFSEGITSLTMVLIVLGTNYFQLSVYDSAMPHNALFVIFILILWLTIRWHEEPKGKFLIPLGILAGLAVIIRPTAGLILLVPMLWGIHDRESWKAKRILLKTHYRQVIAAAAYFAVVVFFQLAYWKMRSGSYFYYSYDPKEHLEWIGPYLGQVLFSFRKGWLIYTPLMIFAIIGFYQLAEKRRDIFFATFFLFFVYLLFVASWPTWWYGGSLGQRAMMETCAILALPLGFFFDFIRKKTLSLCLFVYSVTIFFVLLNLFQTWQYMNFILVPSDMNRDYYFAIFGKTQVTNREKSLVRGFYSNEREQLVNEENFNRRILFRTAPNAFRMSPEVCFSPGISVPFRDLTKKQYAWIRATVWIWSKIPYKKNPGNLVITMSHNGKSYVYSSFTFEEERLFPGRWQKVTLDYMTPWVPDPGDHLESYVWYRGGTELLLRDFSVEIFEPRE
jgi:hypothetical protein